MLPAPMPRLVSTFPPVPKVGSRLPAAGWAAANAGWATPAETSEAITTAVAVRMPFNDMYVSLSASARAVR